MRRRPSGERPPLPRHFGGIARFWLTMILLLAVAPFLGLAAAGGSGGYLNRINETVLERLQGMHSPGLTSFMGAVHVLGSAWTVGVLRWGALLVLVVYRRWQHVLAFLASVVVVGWILSVTAPPASSPSAPVQATIPALVAGQLAPWRPIAGLAATIVSIGYALATAGRTRRLVLVLGAVPIVGVGVAGMYRGDGSPSAVLTGAILGVAIPLVAFRVLAPESSFPVSYRRGKTAHLEVEGPRGEAIRRAVQNQLGMQVMGIEPFGLEGSGGSTPLRIHVAGDSRPDLFGKLYAVNHLRADRWYKLGRMIRYGALEDEKPFNSVRRLVEYEDYMLRFTADLGIPSAAPYGFVELTPEREYLLVTEFLESGREILQAEVDRDTVGQALAIIRSMWDAGLAHRDVKPSNVLVRDGKVHLIDVAFCQLRPSPWRQAVDLANMMLVLALATSPDLVYEEARRQFIPTEIAEAFAATRGVTIPSQLRGEIQRDGRDLIGAFRALAPARAPIRIQRWTVRRIGLTAAVLVPTVIAALLLWSTLHGAGLR